MMENILHAAQPSTRFSCRVMTPDRTVPGLVEDARNGLLAPPRSLPPKYFYDDRGSRLFDRICDTAEYYVTRTEAALLKRHACDILEAARPAHLIELGSGSSRKTRLLLDACAAQDRLCTYWPMDVCEAMLVDAADKLMDRYDWLQVHALVGDYYAGLGDLPECEGRRLFVFLGSTIGNFDSREALLFLRELVAGMRPDDRLLLGADRVKDPAVLEVAYNDAAGVTAEFNRNVLRVLNRELQADFQPAEFAHRAVYNAEQRQVEMYLVARRHQRVRIAALDATLHLESGESILTEISRKFTLFDLQRLLANAGFMMEHHYESENAYFSLLLAKPGLD